MSIVKISDLSIIDYHKSNHIPFELIATSFSIKINSDLGNYIYMHGSGLTVSDMSFVASVKRYVKKHHTDFSFDSSLTKYFGCRSNLINGTKYNCYEIDLDKAYWYAAYQNKFIDEKIFKSGLLVSKYARLIALGNLARVRRRFTFDGENIKYDGEERSVETESVFFYSAYITHLTMLQLSQISGNDMVFFWVDAIFISNKSKLDALKQKIIELGLTFKVKKISYIRVKGDKISVKDSEGIRNFYFPKDIKTEISKYTELSSNKSNAARYDN